MHGLFFSHGFPPASATEKFFCVWKISTLPGSKPEFIDGILEDFAWLGLDYDGEIVFQSRRIQIYEEYLQKISPFVYPCFCTRKELREVAGAPQVTAPGDRLIMPDMGAVYHRTCRFFSPEERKQKTGKNACLRLACPPFEKQEYEIIPEQFHTAAPIFPLMI